MNIHIVETGFFKLDGGAMFGVVPKSMWNKLNPADENNMCTWAMRCLLIEVDDRLILIDTGMGNKQDEKFRSHFYPHGNESLNSSIAKLGFSTEDITDVILTHLHFDHCGGAVYRSENGALLPQFPKAKYWSHSVHLNWALNPNDREKASFLKENIEPLVQSNQLFFIDIDPFGCDSFEFDFVFGHTEAMMIPKISYKGKRIIFAADLMPSSYHIPMPYVMSYDIRPLETLKEREKLLKNTFDNQDILFFEHDPIHQFGTLKKHESGRLVLEQTFSIEDLK
jgi:glyoxylase-like metal-dependent hydrolase (beta-lactamase superfamily II)